MQKETKKDPTQAIEVAVFRTGQEILSEGYENPFFFVILSGQVVLSKNGKRIRTLGEQDIFGLESLLLRKPSNYSAEAVQKCRVAKYGPETLDHLIHQSPRMIQNVLVSILHQLTQTTLNLLDPPQPLLVDKERIHFYADGEIILEEMMRGPDLYRLVSTGGGLQVTIDGREIALINRPGEFFGLPISPANTCVRSIGQSVVEKYGSDDLDIIIRDYPDSARRIMQAMIERLSAGGCREDDPGRRMG